ncbi:MAG: TonB-dependent receptor [Flavobacterium sp.]|jgi:outer membrane receptor protein involved in Fe transport|uniref:TonB-dependent receptor domain-containing protein n=2 Tax=Flavobacterium sp. TaxID=239 RepID=UPI001B68C697|nr:TonB-dependent receptor [Flavobacterium sp.]MBP6146192.1 TonB-dependent receptor [Flavobacterium sp.]MBP7181964.1 TonB-dependent receptor [Flavobacterium sp.]MBP7316651.1 TonB-dependent receptor [Flavobacterium sp.]MBP8887514.1 TonB-dependent receptor [Flavobacterium sp.]HRL71757.1 TonB-dependent receptor [Flavobacterium sp.]
MKIKLILICFIATVFSLQAQTVTKKPLLENTGSISGKVIDKKTNEPLPYVNIVVKENNKVVTGGITSDKGIFQIKNLALKEYVVEIQFIGYKTILKSVKLTENSDVNLNTIAIEEDAIQLKGVEIVSERSTIEQKIDRKVINVGKDLTTAGATASEIMNNIPSVNVDQDGKISLRGNENVRVLVDGRPSNIEASQLLKQIPSTSIKKIELITNPSAKYNPEGMSGIINIVLHKNANDGFNASINTGLTFAKTPKINSSTNLNYKTGKVNFFATYGNNFGKKFNEGSILRLDDQSNQLFDIKNDDKSHLFKIGMDYYINDKNTLSVYTNQNKLIGDGKVDVSILNPDATKNLTQYSKYDGNNLDGTYNLAFKHLTKKEGETLDLEINHSIYSGDQLANFRTTFNNPSIPTSAYSDDISEKRENSTINLDYVNPLNEKSKLEMGAETRIVRTQNNYTTNNSSLSNSNYDYDLDIHSAYVTFGQKFKKIGYQLGARFESYKANAKLNNVTAFKDDYITLYPSASMTYSLSEKDQFQMSYSRRVDRPSLGQTKPIREFSTPRVTSIGNPELQPQFTNSVELNYTKTVSKGSITTGVFVRTINNEINRVLYPDPQNQDKQIMSYDNFDTNTAYGFEASLNYKINSWWDIQPAVDFSSITQKGLVSMFNTTTNSFDFVTKEVNASAFNARFNSNFKATKSLRFLLFGFYRSGVDGVQFNGKEMYKIDAGGRYSFLKDKATLSVRFNDIFDTMKAGFYGDNPYPQTGQFTWESQSVYVGFNYMFGTGKNKSLQRKQRDSNTKEGGGGLF